MEKRDNKFGNILSFPGCDILYALLAIFFMFFYCAFWYSGEYRFVSDGSLMHWDGWFLFALISWGFASLTAYNRGWGTKRFCRIGLLLLLGVFAGLKYMLSDVDISTHIFLYEYSIGCVVYCIVMLCKKPKEAKASLIYVLPVILGLSCLATDNILCLAIVCLVLLTILSVAELRIANACVKALVVFGVAVFYVCVIWMYCPYNPLLCMKDIKDINAMVCFLPQTSLIVEEDGRYVIMDGSSLLENKPVEVSFDTWGSNMKPFEGFSFVGFKYEDTSPIETKFSTFPIMVMDSCVWFTANAGVYEYLNGKKSSKDEVERFTAEIYFDYINLFANRDSCSSVRLQADYDNLQAIFNEKSLDTALIQVEARPEIILCDVARNTSLGILNSWSSDLINNKDYKAAINVFSLQFYLTYLNSFMYDRIHNNFNVNIIRDDNNVTFNIAGDKLKEDAAFSSWGQVCSFCLAMIRVYVNDSIKESLEGLREELEIRIKGGNITDTSLTKHLIAALDTGLYEHTPMLKTYLIGLCNFYYNCFRCDNLPDYASFFKNRFDEVSPVIMLDADIIALCEKMLKLQEVRNEKEMKLGRVFLDELNKSRVAARELLVLQEKLSAEKWLEELLLKLDE